MNFLGLSAFSPDFYLFKSVFRLLNLYGNPFAAIPEQPKLKKQGGFKSRDPACSSKNLETIEERNRRYKAAAIAKAEAEAKAKAKANVRAKAVQLPCVCDTITGDDEDTLDEGVGDEHGNGDGDLPMTANRTVIQPIPCTQSPRPETLNEPQLVASPHIGSSRNSSVSFPYISSTCPCLASAATSTLMSLYELYSPSGSNNNSNNNKSQLPQVAANQRSQSQSQSQGSLSRIFGGSGTKPGEEKLTVQDFDLLKIVGKGAFGKVMLVRKKASKDEGKVYAMKVLKKDAISTKGQIEQIKSERDILIKVRHPYIVRLRSAFQSEDKLYLVTDYYNGGTLFYHLRKSRQFDEAGARFYAAQLLSALDHLHKNHIIHRDLELENVLMDHLGHLALTDFGLSKQNIDFTGGATTFCGTAEYIAPELLKGQKYGAAVDWWSFGILIFEMMQGRTPFFDINRKLMFDRIINTEPSFPPTFSPAACDCIRGLLRVNEMERLGSGPTAAKEIMSTAFFSVIDFDALMKRELPPPFKPDVTGELDTKYVPKLYLQAEAKDSIDESSKKKNDKNPTFDAFNFQGERALNQH